MPATAPSRPTAKAVHGVGRGRPSGDSGSPRPVSTSTDVGDERVGAVAGIPSDHDAGRVALGHLGRQIGGHPAAVCRATARFMRVGPAPSVAPEARRPELEAPGKAVGQSRLVAGVVERPKLAAGGRIGSSPARPAPARRAPGRHHRDRPWRPGYVRRWTSSASDGGGPGADWPITSAAASDTEPAAGRQVVAVGEAVQEAGGVQVAGAGRVDHVARPGGRRPRGPRRRRRPPSPWRCGSARRSRSGRATCCERVVEVVDLVERGISASLANRTSTPSLMRSRNSPRWRSTQNASERVSATRRPASWAAAAATRYASLASGSVEQVALEERAPRPRAPASGSTSSGPSSDDAPRYVFMVRWASGVTTMRHRPVGGPSAAGGCVELDAGGADVVARTRPRAGRRATRPMYAARTAERRDADQGVGGRPSGHLDAPGPWRRRAASARSLVDERHGALREAVGVEELLGLVAEHVDEGVADADDVESPRHRVALRTAAIGTGDAARRRVPVAHGRRRDVGGSEPPALRGRSGRTGWCAARAAGPTARRSSGTRLVELLAVARARGPRDVLVHQGAAQVVAPGRSAWRRAGDAGFTHETCTLSIQPAVGDPADRVDEQRLADRRARAGRCCR